MTENVKLDRLKQLEDSLREAEKKETLETEARKRFKSFYEDSPHLARTLQEAYSTYTNNPTRLTLLHEIVCQAFCNSETVVYTIELEKRWIKEGGQWFYFAPNGKKTEIINHLRDKLEQQRRVLYGFDKITEKKTLPKHKMSKDDVKELRHHAHNFTETRIEDDGTIITETVEHVKGFNDYIHEFLNSKKTNRAFTQQERDLIKYVYEHKTEIDSIFTYAFMATPVFAYSKPPEETAAITIPTTTI